MRGALAAGCVALVALTAGCGFDPAARGGGGAAAVRTAMTPERFYTLLQAGPCPDEPGHHQVTIVTDATWAPNAVVVPGNAGWNQNLIPGASWIWDTTAFDNGGTADLSKGFTIPAGATNITGTLTYAFDDYGDIHVNGTQAATGVGTWFATTQLDLSPYLVPGANTIRLFGYNYQLDYCSDNDCNPAGIVAKATIAYDI